MFGQFLSFSDAAKFADVARNLVSGNGYGSNFSFFSQRIFEGLESTLFPASGVLPLMPYSIAFVFKIFGVSDASVIATSLFFFLLTVLFTYLLAKKLFGKTVGILTSLVVLINQNFIDYAKSGASETLFMFEIVAIPYLMLLKKRWANFISFSLLIITYFTRPQAFIFIAGYILFYLLLNFKPKKAVLAFLGILLIGLFVDRLILLPLSGKYHLYSITGRGTHAITQHSQYVAVSDVVRGVEKQPASVVLTIKKAGTHLFNFYRSLPQIVNPYLFTFFVLSPFVLFKKKEERVFISVVFFTTALSFLLPALTIPFYRYIHPVLPLVYILGVAALVSVLRLIINHYPLTIKNKLSKYLPSVVSFILILVFVVIMQIGIFIHDSKYYRARRNFDRPPVYTVLAWKLKEITDPGDVIVTNLDTWGSWYGERRTVWFPLEPDQLSSPERGVIPFDAIYLTSYLMDDENYFMGDSWRQIFNDPENIENEFIRENFEFAGGYEFTADEVYEKYDSRAILLIKSN
jgi:4-amino-4-deoxy-L-arabinose transferase-like glycosyltransferase